MQYPHFQGSAYGLGCSLECKVFDEPFENRLENASCAFDMLLLVNSIDNSRGRNRTAVTNSDPYMNMDATEVLNFTDRRVVK